MSETQTPNPAEETERRVAPRKTLRSIAVLSFSDERPTLTVRLTDANTGGVGIVSDNILTVNTRCQVSFTLPSNGADRLPIRADAVIVYCSFSSSAGGFRAGLRFLDPPPGVVEQLQAFIETGSR